MHIIVGVLGGVCLLIAVVLAVLTVIPAACVLAFWGVLLLIGLAIERWRYKRLAARPPGPEWQATGERFVDPETGRLVTVYFQPATGERRYVG